ncbi:Pro-kumamolisin, activation domain-containing protein [Cercophora newfieldiana]|uniref:Pro-kumamolisin, activation domain-containing protein n=1 Tax=Cercophora newfieldiana TaxID=92897 RepID=A0AA39Y9V0_9PEZI|nr:Pro-kumamolisin, activation domain-containing protein [Cercophora newfieldiana]
MHRLIFTMRQSVLLSVLLAALGQCGSTVLESLPTTPKGWTRLRDASPETKLKLRVAMQQPNDELFERTLYEISDPTHASYGKHLSQDALASLMAPRAESTTAVRDWLRSSDIPDNSIEDDGEWINLRLTVREASSLLNTTFSVWSYDGTKTERVRALRYSVPEDIAKHITMVAPVTRFGQIHPQRSQIFEVVDSVPQPKIAAAIPPQTLNPACNTSITPECLRALYRVGSYRADPSKRSLLGVTGYLEQWAKYDQLELFNDLYAPYARDANFTEELINGGLNTQGPTEEDSTEANLDVQYAVSMSYKTQVKYYSTGGRGPLVPDLDQPDPNDVSNEPYLEFFGYLLKQPNDKLPQTLTTSYGEDEQSVPRPYAEKVCQMIGQLGARGVSVIFSSGE